MPTVKFDGKSATFFVCNQIIAWFGIPSEIVTDHGSHFQDEMMEELAAKMGFNMVTLLLIIPRKMDK
jgi:hypothetical protein